MSPVVSKKIHAPTSLVLTLYLGLIPILSADADSQSDAAGIRKQFEDALTYAEQRKIETAKERERLIAEREKLDQAQDRLEKIVPEVQEAARDLLRKEAMAPPIPNPNSPFSVSKWAADKVYRGKETLDEFKKLLDAYGDAERAELEDTEKNLTGTTDLESQIQKATEDARAAEQAYENLQSWEVIFQALKDNERNSPALQAPAAPAPQPQSIEPILVPRPAEGGWDRDFGRERDYLREKIDSGERIDGDRFERAREIDGTTG